MRGRAGLRAVAGGSNSFHRVIHGAKIATPALAMKPLPLDPSPATEIRIPDRIDEKIDAIVKQGNKDVVVHYAATERGRPC